MRDFWELRPPDPTHLVDMAITIPKGAMLGSVIIPCALQTLSHSIDVNPALVKEERCPECGGKLPLAEIKETRYKSCPVVTIRLNAPAPKDLVVPITFGIYRGAVMFQIWMAPALAAASFVGLIVVGLPLAIPLFAGAAYFWLWIGRRVHKWYSSVKPTLRPATA